jgi:hypothetical protein
MDCGSLVVLSRVAIQRIGELVAAMAVEPD